MATASVRDRTGEFLTVAERLRKSVASQNDAGASSSAASPLLGSRPGPPGGSGRNGLKNAAEAAGQQSEFAKRASRIGLGIHATSAKLNKLAQLAKRTSMFDDPAQEIGELTAVVKKDIQSLTAAIADLQRFSAVQAQEVTKQGVEHSVTVVDNLKNRLTSATQEFKDVLSMRSENLKVHQNRRALFTASTSDNDTASAGAPFARPRGRGSLFGKSKDQGLLPTHSTPGGMLMAGGGAFNQHQAQQQVMQSSQDSFMQSRAEALQNVESTIAELSSIFGQLATMVAQQGEMAVRIDENMDETLTNVENAQSHLLKYLNNLSNNRWLILKIFMVLVVFLIIFVVFVA